METEFARLFPPAAWADVTLVVAVSGGPDSMALLRLLQGNKVAGSGRLVAAHFNHGTRGADSLDDEAFVVRTCRELGITCEVGRAAEGELDRTPDGFEQAARAARYRFLEETCGKYGARYIATGHTADDQAETILHRILRGTGLAGLTGIPRTRVLNSLTTLIRPLLPFRRGEIHSYLAKVGQPFREDATNADPRFTRNRLRHELLPQLASDFNPQVIEALLRLGSQASEARAVIDELVGKLTVAAIEDDGPDRVVISCDRISSLSSYLIRELLLYAWRSRGWPEQAMTHEKWQELAAMMADTRMMSDTSEVKKVFPGGVTATKAHGDLTLQRIAG